jgi:hypothetical protein
MALNSTRKTVPPGISDNRKTLGLDVLVIEPGPDLLHRLG